MTRRYILAGILLSCLALNMVGCTPPPQKRILWPVPPSTPRIEWLGTFSSQLDFPRTGWQIFREAIIGRPIPQIFQSPYGIVQDSRGFIYVSDNSAGNLLVYDLSARTVEKYSEEPVFTRPAGLAVDAADNLYVVDSAARVVLVFDKNRRPLLSIGSPQELQVPMYIAIDQARARIYVSDPRANKVIIYDRFGRKFGEIGQQPAGSGGVFSFASPQGMAVDKKGNLYVAELLGARVSVFDFNGKYLRSFGERGNAVYQFEAPKDLAFDSDGNLWVADTRRAQIYTYTPQGALLLATGTPGPSVTPFGFSMPTAIFIAPDDTVYITDRLNRRFSLWRYLSQSYLQSHPFTDKELASLQDVGLNIDSGAAVSPEDGFVPPQEAD